MRLAFELLASFCLIFAVVYGKRIGILAASAFFIWSSTVLLTLFFSKINWSLGYFAFYPFILLALPNLFGLNWRENPLILINQNILSFGLIFMITIISIKRLNFSNITQFYVICDLLVFISSLSLFFKVTNFFHMWLLFIGIISYIATDFYSLFDINNGIERKFHLYYFGWPMSFILIMFSQFIKVKNSKEFWSPSLYTIAFILVVDNMQLIYASIMGFNLDFYNFFFYFVLLFLLLVRHLFSMKKHENLQYSSRLAELDDLTGLPNRRKFISELECYLNGSILLLDLDDFKPVNDKHGHDAGDQILRMVSNRFLRVIPENALLARLGGDEFAVLVHDDCESPIELAMALRATCSYPFTVAGNQIQIDVSIGCVANDGRNDLMSRADTAMYQAKRTGVGVWASGT